MVVNSVNKKSGLSAISRKVGKGDLSTLVASEDFLPLKCNVSLRSARDDSRCRSSWNVSRFAQGERCKDISRGERRRGIGQCRGKWWRLVDSVYDGGRLSGRSCLVGEVERVAAVVSEGTSTAARTPAHFVRTPLARGEGGIGNCHSGFVEAD